MPKITDPHAGNGCIVASIILPPDLANALDQAAGEAMCSRAAYVRQLVADGLRASGHLDPLPTPRRHRTPRRVEAVA